MKEPIQARRARPEPEPNISRTRNKHKHGDKLIWCVREYWDHWRLFHRGSGEVRMRNYYAVNTISLQHAATEKRTGWRPRPCITYYGEEGMDYETARDLCRALRREWETS